MGETVIVGKVLAHKQLLKRMLPARARECVKIRLGLWQVEKLCKIRKPVQKCPWGVNLFGSIGGASGLSEGSRGAAAALKDAGLPICLWDLEHIQPTGSSPPYQVNLIHANPNQLPELSFRIPMQAWIHRYNIGYWVWEQETLPAEWMRFFPLFDEIWTPSSFAAEAIRKATELPVTVVPHIINPEYDPLWGRKEFGLPENKFICLLAFDCASVEERKNPAGAIAAFRQAFESQRDSVCLVIKVRNMTGEAHTRLLAQLKDWPNVRLLTDDMHKKRVNSLIRCADVYISLHRAEGFGLVLAEAMYLGTPVIATNWSGNTEFMNEQVACMVDAQLVNLKQDYPPFRKGSRWANPDLDQAAAYLKHLYDDPNYSRQIAARAEGYIRQTLDAGEISRLVGRRMSEIYKELESGDGPLSNAASSLL